MASDENRGVQNKLLSSWGKRWLIFPLEIQNTVRNKLIQEAEISQQKRHLKTDISKTTNQQNTNEDTRMEGLPMFTDQRVSVVLMAIFPEVINVGGTIDEA